MRLDDALSQINSIRSQMEAARVFRGYSWVTTLFSACMAVLTGVVQHLWIPDTAQHVDRYLQLWLTCGAVCGAVVTLGVIRRYRRSESPLDQELTIAAVQQFLPCLILGGLVTYVVCTVSWQTIWIMPGLWSIFFGMGVLASRPLLPKGIAMVGSFYLLCGLCSIEWAKLHDALSPWLMVIPFGGGQALAAGILYWKLERNHARQ